MPDNSNFNTDGSFKWLTKPTSNTPQPTPVVTMDNSNRFTILYASNIKSDIVGQSFKVYKDSLEVANFEISQITSNSLIGNAIIIYSSDLEPVTLIFVDSTESTNADSRLTSILNGGNIT